VLEINKVSKQVALLSDNLAFNLSVLKQRNVNDNGCTH